MRVSFRPVILLLNHQYCVYIGLRGACRQQEAVRRATLTYRSTLPGLSMVNQVAVQVLPPAAGLGTRLREIRQKAKLSQAEVARRMGCLGWTDVCP